MPLSKNLSMHFLKIWNQMKKLFLRLKRSSSSTVDIMTEEDISYLWWNASCLKMMARNGRNVATAKLLDSKKKKGFTIFEPLYLFCKTFVIAFKRTSLKQKSLEEAAIEQPLFKIGILKIHINHKKQQNVWAKSSKYTCKRVNLSSKCRLSFYCFTQRWTLS